MTRVLILGGTTEGRTLAAACAALAGLTTVTSLAGRTSDPLIPAGDLRIGGFGGVAGLTDYLRAERIDAIVDATHPFAAGMSTHAAAAAAATGVPLLMLQRPAWTAVPGDRWHHVATIEAAAAALPAFGPRVFLTTGRQEIAAFAGADDRWFLARSVEPPEPPMPRRLEVVLDRGPFTVTCERALLAEHRIDVLVTKNSGGADAKLTAARERSVPVIMVDRPAMPDVATVATVPAAVDWLRRLSPGGGRARPAWRK